MGFSEFVEEFKLDDEARAGGLSRCAFEHCYPVQAAEQVIAHGLPVLAEPSHRAARGAVGCFAVVEVEAELAGAGALEKDSELCAKNGHGLGR